MAGKKDAIGDSTKPRLSLIPKEALWALGGALTHGEKHYGTSNWKLGIKVTYLLDAALRHIEQFNDGENIDEKSNNHHLGNAMANLAMVIWMCENKPEFDDRWKPESKEKPVQNEPNYEQNIQEFEKFFGLDRNRFLDFSNDKGVKK